MSATDMNTLFSPIAAVIDQEYASNNNWVVNSKICPVEGCTSVVTVKTDTKIPALSLAIARTYGFNKMNLGLSSAGRVTLCTTHMCPQFPSASLVVTGEASRDMKHKLSAMLDYDNKHATVGIKADLLSGEWSAAASTELSVYKLDGVKLVAEAGGERLCPRFNGFGVMRQTHSSWGKLATVASISPHHECSTGKVTVGLAYSKCETASVAGRVTLDRHKQEVIEAAVGAAYKVDKKTTAKVKVNQDGVVTVGLKRVVASGCDITFSGIASNPSNFLESSKLSVNMNFEL